MLWRCMCPRVPQGGWGCGVVWGWAAPGPAAPHCAGGWVHSWVPFASPNGINVSQCCPHPESSSNISRRQKPSLSQLVICGGKAGAWQRRVSDDRREGIALWCQGLGTGRCQGPVVTPCGAVPRDGRLTLHRIKENLVWANVAQTPSQALPFQASHRGCYF